MSGERAKQRTRPRRRADRRTESARARGSGIRSRTSSSRTTRTGPQCCVVGIRVRAWSLRMPPNGTRAQWRWYAAGGAAGSLAVDAADSAQTGHLVRHRADPARHGGRAACFGCFGLHEWAMVYRQREHRHPARCVSGRRDRCRRRVPRPAVHPFRRLPLLHAGCRSAQPQTPRRESSPRSSSRAASMPAWTSTSGRSSSARWCRET